MIDELTKLPFGWSWISLEEITINYDGQRVPVSSSDRRPGTFPYYGASGIIDYVDEYLFDGHYLLIAEDGANLLSRSTPIAFEADGKFWVNNHAHIVQVPGNTIPLSYLREYINSTDLRFYISGSAQPKLNQKNLNRIKIPLPPLNEQRRIVAKIEAVKARSQQVKEALEAIPSLLEQFRQSVLAAAFRGDLTADWREKNPDVEPASVLLERIRRDRQQNKAKNKKQEEINLTNLPELPKSWCWASLGEVSAIQGGIQKQPKRVPNKNAYPFLRVANVPRGGLNLENVHQIELFGNELEKLRLHKGDLLIVEGNGSPSEIGRMAIWDGSVKDCVHQNHLIRVRLDKGLMPEFVEAYWNSPHGRFRVFDVAHTTTGLYTLSVSKIAKLPVPFVPEAEQVVLMQILEKLFKIETYVQAIIRQSEDELDSLDQSILAKAFRGELVPQDPNDEPASVLLERIRAERAKQETAAKTAKKSTTKTSGKRRKKTQQQDSESVQLGLPGLE
ncbi:restriction endonuclease subunit S [Chroococcidiopsis sp. CCNUC1]|uniref:restriction endonuclease subunit S n=1 Tax=Chroococcidiopsis sp. CCNUC1 TaxID=2653189 RepID=UPI0020227568|nr:restriction endonuclease subunit S [Chroococcidiopsis sp. CCNUC1]URD48476.1 restriction endonuclease subunit S [Chroococcidiopsis sp. CCNUC1]